MDIGSDECGGDMPSLQEGQALSLTINSTGCLSADTNAEMTHRPILPCVYEEDEDDHDQMEPDQHTLKLPTASWRTLLSRPRSSIVHNYTGAPRQKEDSKAPHINDSSSPASICIL
jgi:hypothetical protein